MSRFIVFIVAVALGGAAAFAQDTPHPRSKHQKAATQAQTSEEPTADISAVPRNVQKWFGGAVDDILTGADKAVDPGRDKR